MPRSSSMVVVALLLVGLGVAVPSPASARLGREAERPARPHVAASVTRQLRLGDALRLRARVRGASHARVVLQERVGRRWVVRATAQAVRGRALVRWQPPRRGAIHVMRVAIKRGSAIVAATRSGRLLIRAPVRPLAPRRVTAGAPGRVRVSGHPRLTPGDIIAVGIGRETPQGLLESVRSTRRRGHDTVVKTEPASLLAAVPNGSIKAHLPPEASSSRADTAKKTITCKGGASAEVTGGIELTRTIDFEAKWSWRRGVQSARLTGSVDADAKLAASVRGAVSCSMGPVTIAEFHGTPVQFMAGPVPVVLTPNASVELDGRASAEADVTSTLHASANATAGVKWTPREVSPITSFTKTFGFDPPALTANGHAEANLTPKIDVRVYGVAGPQLAFKSGLSLDASKSANPWWTLTAPVDLTASLVVPALKLSTPRLHVYRETFRLADSGRVEPTPTPTPTPIASVTPTPQDPDPPQRFTRPGTESPFPMGDGDWLLAERGDAGQRYTVVSDRGEELKSWSAPYEPYSVVSAPDGTTYMVAEDRDAGGYLVRIAPRGADVLIRRFEPDYRGSQSLALSSAGRLFWLYSEGPNANEGVAELDTHTLEPVSRKPLNDFYVRGLVPTTDGPIVVNSVSHVFRAPYSAWVAGDDSPIDFSETAAPIPPAQDGVTSVGVDGTVANLQTFPYDCVDRWVGRRGPDGTSWGRTIDGLAGDRLPPACEVNDVDVLADGQVVVTLLGADSVYLLRITREGTFGALTKVGDDDVTATSIADAAGSIVTAYSHFELCEPETTDRYCPETHVVRVSGDRVVEEATLPASARALRPAGDMDGITVGNGQVIVPVVPGEQPRDLCRRGCAPVGTPQLESFPMSLQMSGRATGDWLGG